MKRFWELAVAAMLLGAVGPAPQQHDVAQEHQYLTGQFLVATPEMGDPRFVQSVIYMISHDQDGAMGLVINRPVAQGPLSDLLKALGREGEAAKGTVTVHYGGPVEPERLFVLHSSNYVSKETTVLGNGLPVGDAMQATRACYADRAPWGFSYWLYPSVRRHAKRNLFCFVYYA